MTPPIQRADQALRRMVMWMLLVASAVGAASIVWIQDKLERLRILALSAPMETRTELFWWLFAVLASTAVLLLISAAVMFQQASRIRRDRRFPPRGTRVLRDTPILEGDAAQRRAIALQIMAALLCCASLSILAVAYTL